MKILFFFPISPVLTGNRTAHNGGGWTASFLKKILEDSEHEVAIGYEGDGTWGECAENGVILFPHNPFQTKKNKLKRKFSVNLEEKLLLPIIQKAVDDFMPDVIHIFGSENPFGCIAGYQNIPCIIHLQGFLPSYYNAKFPPGVSKTDCILKLLKKTLQLYKFLWFDSVFKYRAEREIRIIRQCNSFFGRTQWDKAIVNLFHPEANYFYCSEILRPEFYEKQGMWHSSGREHKILISTLSTPLYKGHDLILKTAKLLKEFTDLDFEWRIYGGADLQFWQKRLQISAGDVNVLSCGVASAEKLRDELLNADLYIHTSYIDNSPNSVCEAQLLGVPVIAVNSGGVSSIVEDQKSGLLVPANDPVMLAEKIKTLLADSALAHSLSENSAEISAGRHDPDTVTQAALAAYEKLLQTGNSR